MHTLTRTANHCSILTPYLGNVCASLAETAVESKQKLLALTITKKMTQHKIRSKTNTAKNANIYNFHPEEIHVINT